jgi:hypothetical protein
MLEGNDLGHTSIKNGKAIAAGLDVPTVGGDRQGHARVVGHGARGTSRQAPLHHHTGDRSEGAGGLESERLGTGREIASPSDGLGTCRPGLSAASATPRLLLDGLVAMTEGGGAGSGAGPDWSAFGRSGAGTQDGTRIVPA